MTTVPSDLDRHGHVRFADSFAAGLIAAGEEFGARLIVTGSARGSILGRYSLGSVASELLHSSTIPVALAPAGTAGALNSRAAIDRITVAIGARPGADALLDEAVELAADAGSALRLVSLVPFDAPPGLDTGEIRQIGATHSSTVLDSARQALPDDVEVVVEQASGDSVEDAVAHLPWQEGEVILVGSSRLAQPRRLFLGSTAAKMLRVLPVPMIVVPRTRNEAGDR